MTKLTEYLKTAEASEILGGGAPKLTAWQAKNDSEALTVLSLPVAHCRKLRTTNMLERINKEIEQRARVATLLPSEQSALRMVTGVW